MGGGMGFPGGNTGTDEQKSPQYFYDLNGKMTFTPTKKDMISLAVFNGHDYNDNTPQFSFGGGGGRPNMGGGGGRPDFGDDIPDFGGGWGGDRVGNLAMDNQDFEKYGNFGTSLRWERKFNDRLSMNWLASYSNFYATRDQRRQMAIQRSDETETVTTYARRQQPVRLQRQIRLEIYLERTEYVGIWRVCNQIRHQIRVHAK